MDVNTLQGTNPVTGFPQPEPWTPGPSTGEIISSFSDRSEDSSNDFNLWNWIWERIRKTSGLNFYENLWNVINGRNFNGSVKDFLSSHGDELYSDNNQFETDSDLPGYMADIFKQALEQYNSNLNRQYEFNSLEAQKNREWQEYMQNTYYQRAIQSMKEAGINPLLALGSIGGFDSPSGSSASGSLGNSNSLFSSMASAVLGDKKLAVSLISSLLGIFKVLFKIAV